MTETLSEMILQQIIHQRRETESLIIYETEPPKVIKQALIGAHLNVHDYYGKRPFIIFSIPIQPKNGQIFKEVFLLDPKIIPEESPCILMNGVFLRECLPYEIKDELSDKIVRIHSLDGLRLIFDDEDYIEQITRLQKEKNVFIIGVYGNNPIHLTRGMSHETWKCQEK